MQKSIYFSLAFIISINFTFSQFYGGALFHLKYGYNTKDYWKFYNSDYQDSREGFLTNSKRKELGLKEINFNRIDKKGKISSTKLIFNSQGRLLSSKSKNYERVSTYKNDTIEASRFVKTKRKTRTFNKMFDENNRTLTDERFENGKLVSKTENSYVNSNLVNAKLLHKRKNYEMKYVYNENGKLSQSEFYKKGKLKQKWVYECKPEGQLLASVKTEIISSKCEYREESADGSYAVFTRTIMKGKPFLLKKTYSKDSVLLIQENFKNDSILTYSASFINNVALKQYYKNGKLNTTEKTVYNSNRKCIEKSRLKKNKLKYLEKFAYDAQNNEILHESFKGKNQKLIYIRINQYDVNGLNCLEEFSNKKDRKITSKTVKTYYDNGTIKSNEYFHKGKFKSKREYEYIY